MGWISQLLQAFARPLQWWVTVAVWEQAVLVRLGKRTHHLMPGVHFRIPFVDRVVRICVRDRIAMSDTRTFSTRDGKALTVGLAIRYTVVDARKMIERAARPERILVDCSYASAGVYICARASGEIRPAELADRVGRDLHDLGLCDYGIDRLAIMVTTYVYTRAIRLIQAQENGYSSQFDTAIDDRPTSTS